VLQVQAVAVLFDGNCEFAGHSTHISARLYRCAGQGGHNNANSFTSFVHILSHNTLMQKKRPMAPGAQCRTCVVVERIPDTHTFRVPSEQDSWLCDRILSLMDAMLSVSMISVANNHNCTCEIV